jgi:uncharacterized protein
MLHLCNDYFIYWIMNAISHELILEAILIVAVYSILGWILEFIYRFILHNKIINPGVFYGPYLPIYGFSVLGIILLQLLFENGFITIIAGTAFVTLFEYSAGTFLEKYIGIKLWDYSEQRFNIKGRICLKYSVFWAVLISLFLFFVHPYFTAHVIKIPYFYKLLIAVFLAGVFFYDSVFTVFMMLNIRKTIEDFNSNYRGLSIDTIKNKFVHLSRLINGFPYFGREIRQIVGNTLAVMFNDNGQRSDIEDILKNINPDDYEEYYKIISDIIANPEFRKTIGFKHHHSSIYEHSLYVSYYSYRLAKKFKLDHKSTARGALLHDFFLYDWKRPHPEKGKNHGKEHPKTALRNAGRQFTLNDTEKDIILNHMWPFTITFPNTMETMVVLMVDKFMASKEFFQEAKLKIGSQVINFLNSKQSIGSRKKR